MAVGIVLALPVASARQWQDFLHRRRSRTAPRREEVGSVRLGGSHLRRFDPLPQAVRYDIVTLSSFGTAFWARNLGGRLVPGRQPADLLRRPAETGEGDSKGELPISYPRKYFVAPADGSNIAGTLAELDFGSRRFQSDRLGSYFVPRLPLRIRSAGLRRLKLSG
ncbi:MAG TPA: hypothetical protein VI039_12140 [Solirubrobacterales bacterium]